MSGKGQHPKHGKASVISRAWTHAPDDASRQTVEAVAFRALADDRDPVDVWREVLTE